MGWREEFNRTTGPGLILGIPAGDLVELLYENGFQVSSALLAQSRFRRRDQSDHDPRPLARKRVPGAGRGQADGRKAAIHHWPLASGTTHLHNLISVDPRFAYANFSQISIPHSFLLAEWAPLGGAGYTSRRPLRRRQCGLPCTNSVGGRVRPVAS